MKKSFVNPDQIERVVVRGARWIGDAVMTIPALVELRRVLPNAYLTLAAPEWSEGVFADANFIDELLVTEGKANNLLDVAWQASEWRARRFNLAVLFPNSFASALTARIAGVELRVGYRTDGRGWLLTHPLALPDWRGRRHEAFNYLHIVAELEQSLYGVSQIDEARIEASGLQVLTERQEEARSLVCDFSSGVRESLDDSKQFARPLVVVCPGSTNSRAKRWSAASYAKLCDRFIAELDANVVLIGAGEELEVSHEVVMRMQHQPLVMTGRLDLAKSTALLSIADLVISNDTGPAHIAGALYRPTIVIFGPTNPITTRPFSATAVVLRDPPTCAPCMLRDCPIDHRCMTNITPEAVYDAAKKILAKKIEQHEYAEIGR